MRKYTTSTPPVIEQFDNFTGREDEQRLFQQLLNAGEDEVLPVLMFYGVGGIGKSWLLRHLQEKHCKEVKIPCIKINFDPSSEGISYRDSSIALARIARGLGVECPRFWIAHKMLRYKQGQKEEPMPGSLAEETAWELVCEGSKALLKSVPGVDFLVWLEKKLCQKKIRESALGTWLLKKGGHEDFLKLRGFNTDDIYQDLPKRLAQDLEENLPIRQGKRCRVVVFMDTFEGLRRGDPGISRQYHPLEKWIADWYQYLQSVQIVIAGQNKLNWAEVDPDWENRRYLRQLGMGGLSITDARKFLGKCKINSNELENAILRVSKETSGKSFDEDETCYHPLCLGLCVDIINTERNNNRPDPDPEEFNLKPGDICELTQRFLNSLNQNNHRNRVLLISMTPRFDETAARQMIHPAPGPDQDTAWQELMQYSFIQELESDWYTLHSMMRSALEGLIKPEELQNNHLKWIKYWKSRMQSNTDVYASLAWYHLWKLSPQKAIQAWNQLAENARNTRHMKEHYDLLSWWEPTGIEGARVKHASTASALNILGTELCYATLGLIQDNLRRAIACYKATLRVYTERCYPSDWAGTQNNLGNTYGDLPTGDRGENLQRAIAYYKAAQRVYTEKDYPFKWAMTQNNLGTAYADLPVGDRVENLQKAIECYEAALRVRTEKNYPSDWTMIQNNLGTAYADLPVGDRVENLQKAIACYEAVLRVRTEESYPSDFAMTQNNLGVAYKNLPVGDRGENLQKAIECYEAALRVYTEKDCPSDWAATQNNLGVAYKNLPVGDRVENLQKAIACYEAALRVRTEENYPSDWAMTQYNLGIAYHILPAGDRVDNLQRAIAYYEAALKIRTEKDFPEEFGDTSFNLADAYEKLGEPSEAMESLRRAARAYRSIGLIAKAKEAEELCNSMQP